MTADDDARGWPWWRILIVVVLGFGLPVLGGIRALLVLTSPAADEGRRWGAIIGLGLFGPIWLIIWIWLVVSWLRKRREDDD